LDHHGPAELIRQVRELDAADSDGQQWSRYKTRDDATAIFLRMEEPDSVVNKHLLLPAEPSVVGVGRRVRLRRVVSVCASLCRVVR
jgi:hypothetical protein